MKRRTYLKSAGVALGSSVFSGVGAGARDYDRVVDIVEAGADNEGGAPIDDVLQDVLGDDTLVEFADGEYVIEHLSLWGLRNFGMRATGDATLVPGRDYDRQNWIAGSSFRDLLFEGFTIDNTEEGVAPSLRFLAEDGLVVRDVTKRGLHDGPENAFQFRITDPDGSGVVERLRASDGSTTFDEVSNAATGVYVDSPGPLTFRDCRVEGFGDNGLYASHSDSPITVEGGLFRDNDVAQVRLGSAGSSVTGAAIAVEDPPRSGGNYRGIRVADGPGPVTIEDCDVRMERGQGTGAIVGAYSGGSFTVRNTRVHVERPYTSIGSDGHDTSWGIYVDDADGVDPGRRVIEDISVTGSGHENSAMLFKRGRNRVENVCISQSGQYRKGIRFASRGGNDVSGASIEVPGETILGGDSASISDLGETASCAVARIGSALDSAGATLDAEAVSTGSDDGSDEHVVVIDGTGASGIVRYELTVTGSIEHDPEHGTFGGVDAVEGRTASGAVGDGVDAYRYAGTIATASVTGDDGGLVVTVDGESVDPSSLGG